ncbi:unnamed protein product [Soboliphyme baturini]|uniref:Sushi domain-containing protein n=1 Tax=Soboliphyme baturini TaxID=241478 RepID=A0A3P8BI57_9BILA|nr:unnamed protein product [Soboliphyme baturini]
MKSCTSAKSIFFILVPCLVPRISNGFISKYRPDDYVYHGERVKVECAIKYELANADYPTCNNGSWSNVPRCTPRYCPHPKVVIGQLNNGIIKLEGSMGEYEFKDYIQPVGEYRTIVFECNKGYVLQGEPRRYEAKCTRLNGFILGPTKATCVNGSWQPKVKPRCVLQTHPKLSNRIMWDVLSRDKRQFRGGSLHLSDVIYSPANISAAHQLKRKDRSRSARTSKINGTVHLAASDRLQESDTHRLSCEIPGVKNGFFVMHNEFLKPHEQLYSGARITMYCLDGFELVGNDTSECRDGIWIDAFGHCQKTIDKADKTSTNETSCPPPIDLRNVEDRSPRLLSTNEYLNGTIISYPCDRFFSHPVAREAQAVQCINGSWVALLKSCARKRNHSHKPRSGKMDRRFYHQGRCPFPEVDADIWQLTSKFHARSSKSTFRNGFEFKVCQIGFSLSLVGFSNSSFSQSDCLFKPENFENMELFDAKTSESLTFKQRVPHNAKFIVRCRHVGLFQLIGSATITCQHGVWVDDLPHCRAVGYPYLNDRPPAIVWRVVKGDISVSVRGELIVRQASYLHLDCIYPRSKGQPTWEYTSSYRHYPQHWDMADADHPGYVLYHFNRKTQQSPLISIYRLAIYMTRPEDSGLFYCIDPYGRRHAVKLIVKGMILNESGIFRSVRESVRFP